MALHGRGSVLDPGAEPSLTLVLLRDQAGHHGTWGEALLGEDAQGDFQSDEDTSSEQRLRAWVAWVQVILNCFLGALG